MPNHEKYKRRRKALWEQNPNCVHCDTPTILPEHCDLQPGKPQPRNMATIDHIYPSFHPKRRRVARNYEQRYWLSCLNCNEERGHKEALLYGLERLRKRAKKIAKKKHEKSITPITVAAV